MLDALPLARFQTVGKIEHGEEVVGLPVVHAQEVAALQLDCDHAQILAFRRT
jgi:hypothetical protein